MDSSDPVRASLLASYAPLIDSWNNRCEPDPVLHEHLVETKRLHDAGVKSGAIEEDAVMVSIPQGWRLIAAPQMDSPGLSLIFWEPSDDEDHVPSFTKVVRDLCSSCGLALIIWHEGRGMHTWS